MKEKDKKRKKAVVVMGVTECRAVWWKREHVVDYWLSYQTDRSDQLFTDCS